MLQHLATSQKTYHLFDFKNIDSGTIISYLQALKNILKDLRQESVFNKALFNQLAEVLNMVSELTALAKRKSVIEQLVGLLVLTSLQLKTCIDPHLMMLNLRRKTQRHTPKQYKSNLSVSILILFPQLLMLALLA